MSANAAVAAILTHLRTDKTVSLVTSKSCLGSIVIILEANSICISPCFTPSAALCMLWFRAKARSVDEDVVLENVERLDMTGFTGISSKEGRIKCFDKDSTEAGI